jgi:DNA gyrase subunit B
MAKTKRDLAAVYSPEVILIHSAVEHVRRRPGMYIGDVGTRGLHYLIEEACRQPLANLPQEGGQLEVEVCPEDRLIIRDNGSGVGVPGAVARGIHPLVYPLIEPVGVSSHANYGLLMVNALSEELVLETNWEGQRWRVESHQGQITQEPVTLASADTGTVVAFRPDPTVFQEGPTVDRVRLARRLEELAALRPGLRTRLVDQAGSAMTGEWYHPGGMGDLLRAQLEVPPFPPGICQVRGSEGNMQVDAALCWAEGSGFIMGFAGLEPCDAGTHVRGLQAALTRTLRVWMRQNGNTEEARAWTPEDLRAGLRAIIAVQHPELRFLGASRLWLGNPELAGLVQRFVGRALGALLAEYPTRTSPLFDHLATAGTTGDSA